MSVVKIKVLSVVGRMSELDAVTEALGRSCAFHPDNALSFYSDTSGFSPLNEENPYAGSLNRLTQTAGALGKRLEPMSARELEKAAPPEDWKPYVENTADSFARLAKQADDARQKARKDREEMEKIRHFVGLDLNLDELKDCKFIKVRFGSLPKESYEKLNTFHDPFLSFFSCTEDDTHVWGVYCAPLDSAGEVDRVFSSLYFERTRMAELSGTPESMLRRLNDDIGAQKAAVRSAEEETARLWDREKQKMREVYSWLSEKFLCFGIRRYAVRYGDSFILMGWVPADRQKQVAASLERLESVKCTFDSAEEEDVLVHSPPVQLKNKKLFRPFEYLVQIYGTPSYNEVDPTPLVAVTYVLLFGIMFADLGQGLFISLAGWWMDRKKKMALGKVLIPCGFSSAVFGTLFGSVFGFEHALDPFFRLFGLSGKPISVMDRQTTSVIIYCAVGLGISFVIIAMLTNIFSSLRRRRYTEGLFGPNGAAGLVFYGAVVFGLAGPMLLGRSVFTAPYVLGLIVLPLLLMFLRELLGGLMEGRPDWKPESWGDYIMQNFFEVFEFVLSFLTNTMSFIRVGAFVLVHAGMMMVVFMLAEMTSGVGFVLIVAFGNLFVIALEGLLVGIQSMRLEFYEMFSRFFDGDGRPYAPVVVGQEA